MFVCRKANRSAKSRASRAGALGISPLGLRLVAVVLAAALVVQTGVGVPGAGLWRSAAGSLPSEEDPVPTRMAEEIKHAAPAPCAASRLKQSRHGGERWSARDREVAQVVIPRCRPIRADLEARNGLGGPLRC